MDTSLFLRKGNDEYAIIDRASYQHIANFAIVGTDETRQAEKIDGTSHTDGIDLTSVNLGQALPNGIFVAQDDDNTSHGETQNQNLKVVPLERILNQIELISND
jgi:3-phytase